MTQEAPNYVGWRPEYDGHAPPNWREGMDWAIERTPREQPREPRWMAGMSYWLPTEALTAPNEDVVPGPIQDALYVLRQYPAEELAKHGITLAPEKDWATELSEELRELYLYDQRNEAIALIRERVVLKGEG